MSIVWENLNIKHICGIFWIATYLLAIRRGYLDRSYGIPAIAVAMNIAWEVYDTFFSSNPIMGGYGIIWLLLDFIILYQIVIYYGSKQATTVFKTAAKSILGIAAWFIALYLSHHFNTQFFADAFFQNAVMSLLFLQMILLRKNMSGQSLYIALCKLIGTGIVTIPIMLNGRLSIEDKITYYPLFLTILGADLVYIFICIYYCKKNSSVMLSGQEP